jgi:hypothetical protein
MLFEIHFKGLAAASRIWDVNEYAQHTKGFRALYQQQKRTPNLKRTIAPTVGRRSLLQMEIWIAVLHSIRYVKRILASKIGVWLVLPTIGVYAAYKFRFFLLYLLFVYVSLILGLKLLEWKSIVLMAFLYALSTKFFGMCGCSVFLFSYFFPTALKMTRSLWVWSGCFYCWLEVDPVAFGFCVLCCVCCRW